jgi:hypothetical protein
VWGFRSALPHPVRCRYDNVRRCVRVQAHAHVMRLYVLHEGVQVSVMNTVAPSLNHMHLAREATLPLSRLWPCHYLMMTRRGSTLILSLARLLTHQCDGVGTSNNVPYSFPPSVVIDMSSLGKLPHSLTCQTRCHLLEAYKWFQPLSIDHTYICSLVSSFESNRMTCHPSALGTGMHEL